MVIATKALNLLIDHAPCRTATTLLETIKFDHGYTRDSAPAGHFVRVLEALDAADQRRFLRFVTGSPRLPPGGIAALQVPPIAGLVYPDSETDPDRDGEGSIHRRRVEKRRLGMMSCVIFRVANAQWTCPVSLPCLVAEPQPAGYDAAMTVAEHEAHHGTDSAGLAASESESSLLSVPRAATPHGGPQARQQRVGRRRCRRRHPTGGQPRLELVARNQPRG